MLGPPRQDQTPVTQAVGRQLSRPARSLLATLMRWAPDNPNDVDIPEQATMPVVQEAMDRLAAKMKPATEAEINQLLSILSAAVPTFADETNAGVWVRYCRDFPPDVLERAIDKIIRTHRYNSNVLIADVVQRCEHDWQWIERKRWRRQLTALRDKMEQDNASQAAE